MFKGIQKTAVSDGSVRMPVLETIPGGWNITTNIMAQAGTWTDFWFTGLPLNYLNANVAIMKFARLAQVVKDDVPIQSGAFPSNFSTNRISNISEFSDFATAPIIGREWKFIGVRSGYNPFPVTYNNYPLRLTSLKRLTYYDVQVVIVSPSLEYMKLHPDDNLITIATNGFSNILTFRTPSF